MAETPDKALQARREEAIKKALGERALGSLDIKGQMERGTKAVSGKARETWKKLKSDPMFGTPETAYGPQVLGMAPEMGASVSPAGAAVDIKDMAQAIKEKDLILGGLAAAGFVPGVGDVAKAAGKKAYAVLKGWTSLKDETAIAAKTALKKAEPKSEPAIQIVDDDDPIDEWDLGEYEPPEGTPKGLTEDPVVPGKLVPWAEGKVQIGPPGQKDITTMFSGTYTPGGDPIGGDLIALDKAIEANASKYGISEESIKNIKQNLWEKTHMSPMGPVDQGSISASEVSAAIRDEIGDGTHLSSDFLEDVFSFMGFDGLEYPDHPAWKTAIPPSLKDETYAAAETAVKKSEDIGLPPSKFSEEELQEARRLWLDKGTKSPYFKQYWKKSKVVNKSGKPLLLHHGSPSTHGFGQFDASKTGSSNDAGWFGTGFYMSPYRNTARDYAEGQISRIEPTATLAKEPLVPGWALVGDADQGVIGDFYMSLQNPYRWTDSWLTVPNVTWHGERLPDDIHDAVMAKVAAKRSQPDYKKGYNEDQLHSTAVREVLEERGYDGIIIGRGKIGEEYVAFRPEQIKSASRDSQGTFSGDERILWGAAPGAFAAERMMRDGEEEGSETP